MFWVICLSQKLQTKIVYLETLYIYWTICQPQQQMPHVLWDELTVNLFYLKFVILFCNDGQLHKWLNEKFQPYTVILEGRVVWVSRVVVPSPGRQSVLEELHDSHLGTSKMKSLARAYIWWPKLYRDIENLVRSCILCQQTSVLPSKVPLHQWE